MGWDYIVVIGKPRKSFSLIEITIKRNLMKNFRVQKVYKERIIKTSGIHTQEENEIYKDRMQGFADSFNARND